MWVCPRDIFHFFFGCNFKSLYLTQFSIVSLEILRATSHICSLGACPKWWPKTASLVFRFLTPPIKVHSHHWKAISHVILYGIVREFAGVFSGVYSRCKRVLKPGFAAIRIQHTYHLVQLTATFEQWYLMWYRTESLGSLQVSFPVYIQGANAFWSLCLQPFVSNTHTTYASLQSPLNDNFSPNLRWIHERLHIVTRQWVL